MGVFEEFASIPQAALTAVNSAEALATLLPDIVNKVWATADDTLVEMTRRVGLSREKYSTMLKDITRATSVVDAQGLNYIQKFGKGNDDVARMLSDHAKAVGRNLSFTQEQLEDYTSLEIVLGDTGTKIAQSFSEFGVDASQTEDILSEVLGESKQIGISFEKIAQDIQNNMGEIQSYTFENGIRGFTKMAEKAAEVNLSMNQAMRLADKINEGGIESAINMGANLQVLGGQFAQMSNPMEMFYEATSDVGALQDRIVDMFKGMGTYNSKSGQVEIDRFNRMRIKQAASQMGLDSKEIFNMINRSATKDEIGRQLAGSTLSEKDQEFLKNTAQINSNGEAIVNIDGANKKVSELKTSDIEYLRGVKEGDTGESINKIAIDVHSIAETTKMREIAGTAAGQRDTLKPTGSAFKAMLMPLNSMIEKIGDKVGGEKSWGLRKLLGGLISGIPEHIENLGNFVQNTIVPTLSEASQLLYDGIDTSTLSPDEQNDYINMTKSIDLLTKYMEENPGASMKDLANKMNTLGFANSGFGQITNGVDIIQDTLSKILNGVNSIAGKKEDSHDYTGGFISVPHARGGPINATAKTMLENGGPVSKYYNQLGESVSVPEAPSYKEKVFAIAPNALGGVQNTINEEEFVMRAEAVKKIGVGPLTEMNKTGIIPHAEGGPIEIKEGNQAYVGGGVIGSSKENNEETIGSGPINVSFNEITGKIDLNVSGMGHKIGDIPESIKNAIIDAAYVRVMQEIKPFQKV